MAIIWRGSYYSRGKDANRTFRQRGSGFVVKNVKVIQRKGKRDRTVLVGRNNFKGIEPLRKNYYGQDFHKNKVAFRKFTTRVKANRIDAKKPRKGHTRILR